VTVIGVPSGAGARRNGHERSPASLRGAGRGAIHQLEFTE